MPTTSSPRRATRAGDRRGQGTLEYVGIVAVAAILVAAVVLTDSGARVRTAIGCQVRSIVTQGGSCGAGGDAPTTYDASGGTGPRWPGVSATPPTADGPRSRSTLSGRDTHTYDDDWFGLDDVDPPSVGVIDALLVGGGAMLVSTANDNRTSLYDDGTIVQGHAYYVQPVDPDKGTVTIVNPGGLDSFPPITTTHDEFEASFIRYDPVDLGRESR